MSNASNKKIELTEIADYRGNLSFAEENNPIPFTIKSVFWSTISTDISWTIPAQIFLIILDGKATVNGELLDRPNQAYPIKDAATLDLKIISEEATILLVMDKTIPQEDKSNNLDFNILEMPQACNFHGLNGAFANSGSSLPFDIKRVYFTYDIPETAKRGGHAHKDLTSIIFAVKGSFDVLLDDGKYSSRIQLDCKNKGLHIETGMWRELENFATKSLVLVLASELFCEEDYIWEFEDFKAIYSTNSSK